MFGVTPSDVALVLSTAEGITGYEHRPQAIKDGDAWPIVEQISHGPGATWVTDWRIVVILSGDPLTAESELFTYAPAIVEALADVIYVNTISPVTIPTNSGDMLGLEISGVSE